MTSITDHYASEGIAERILAAVRATLPAGAPLTPDALAPCDHFHGRGLVATQDLVRLLDPQARDKILDLGSGIGGPARWIAAHYGCHVTGIDLTPAFCAAARELTAATGLGDRVSIVDGSATALPFPDHSFDRAYSHNVIMNIADKPAFYREAFHVLKPGGVLVLANLIAGPNGDGYYPTPWAATAASSFLATLDETRAQMAAAGFEIVRLDDVTARTNAARRAQASAPPSPLGIHLLMGPRIKELQANSARSEAEGRIGTMEAVLRRPH